MFLGGAIKPRSNKGPVRSVSAYRRCSSCVNLVYHRLSEHSSSRQQRPRNSESLNAVHDRCEQLKWHRNFGQLKRHVLCLPNLYRTDLDRFLP
jgi:hypothetical protein